MRQAWLWGSMAILAGASALAQAPASGTLRIIAFGAHPDDCDQKAGGTAAKWAALGHQVKFVAVTNGDAGHQTEGGGALGPAAAGRGGGGGAAVRHRGIRHARQPRRPARPVRGRARAGHPKIRQ